MLQRSTWSGLVLSAAVLSAAWLTGVPQALGQETAPAPAAPAADATTAPASGEAAAPTGPLKSLADDYMHYSLVNNVELAKANGQAIINANPAPKDLLAAFEDAANGRDPRDIMQRDQKRPELRDISVQLLDRLEEGYRSVARDPVRIRADLDRLGNGPRAYDNARDHLVAAGQFAAPLYIEYLQNDSKKDLHPYILRVMGEVGRPLLLPLLEELQDTEPGLRISLINVIGQIGYRQALPALRTLQADAGTTGELKNAVDRAIASIDKSAAANGSPAELYLQSAQSYFDRKPSYQPLLPNEKTNPVWEFDKGLNNVTPLPVPTVIWTDVMALRNAEMTLKLDANNTTAVSLWLAANLRREITLPAGMNDPTHDKSKPEAAFYARAFGPSYVNPVLAKALDAHDTALSLVAINALEATGGINNLVSAANGAPLVRALSYPDRAIRFQAAFALARANPAAPFNSSFRVVPILAEALSSNGSPTALVIGTDDDKRNKLADTLRNSASHYTVYSGPTLQAALEQARQAPSFDLVAVPAGADLDRVSGSIGAEARLMGVPVLVSAPAGDLPNVKTQIADRKGYAAVEEGNTDENAMSTALGAARSSVGSVPVDPEMAKQFGTTSLGLLGTIAADHKSIYNINDAVPALAAALKDKRPEIATAAANVLGQVNNVDAQKAIATAALGSDTDAGLRTPMLNALAESAKHAGNTLDASQVNSLIKLVQTESDGPARTAAATALGALNVPSNQASTLILQQSSATK